MRKENIALSFLALILISSTLLVAASKQKPATSRKSKKRNSPKNSRSSDDNQCSTSCHERDCGNFGIKYGKYCGVGNTGCAGEIPCDDVDACCKDHDYCVEKSGVFSSGCHKTFISCVEQYLKSSSQGFSKLCPYEKIIPVMKQGIEMTMAFTGGMSNEL